MLILSIIVSFIFGYIAGGLVNGARVTDHLINQIKREDVGRGIKKYKEKIDL